MSKLIPIQIDEQTTIYIEAAEGVDLATPPVPTQEESRERTRADLGKGEKGIIEDTMRAANQGFQAIETTLRSYTSHTLYALKQVATANIDKVTLEFGIEVGGEAGVPYVTKGTAASNLKITVECSFPD